MTRGKDYEVIRSLESDPERKQQEIADLRARLDGDTKGQPHLARVEWLFSHLEEYLDRWILIAPYYSMSQFVHNDLHVILRIAVDLIDEELPALFGAEAFKQNWQEFALIVRKINKDSSHDISKQLMENFQTAKNHLLAIKAR